MKIGPRYKRARRLGADIFEKTQTPKYTLRAARRARVVGAGGQGYGRSEFGIQFKEKQRARYLYGLGERQFARYVRTAVEKKGVRDDEFLFTMLETRLDNVLYRLGFAPTRSAARQIAAHGHFTVNDVRITIPSFAISLGDVIRLRKASKRKPRFYALMDASRDYKPPMWLRLDLIKEEAAVVGMPKLVRNELPFNISAILEFYRR